MSVLSVKRFNLNYLKLKIHRHTIGKYFQRKQENCVSLSIYIIIQFDICGGARFGMFGDCHSIFELLFTTFTLVLVCLVNLYVFGIIAGIRKGFKTNSALMRFISNVAESVKHEIIWFITWF